MDPLNQQRAKLAKLNAPPPPNYVAGLGRGATGFTTRSDIGPARTPNEPFGGDAPMGYVAGRGRGATGFGANRPPTTAPGAPTPAGLKRSRDDLTGGGDLMADNQNLQAEDSSASGGGGAATDEYGEGQFDKWNGFGEMGLFAGGVYEAEDEEADRIFSEIDAKMDARRKKRKDAKSIEEMEKFRSEHPELHTQFADIKKDLASLSEEDWLNIPEIGDFTIKRRKREIYTPTPDTLLERAQQESAQQSGRISIPASAIASAALPSTASSTPFPSAGSASSIGTKTPLTDLRALNEARETMMKIKLTQVSDSVTGQTVVDPKNYMSSLSSMKITNDAEIGDLKRARLLLRSVTTTNPGHPPGWIAAARVEEIAGRIATARNIIFKGCEACPKSEDIWLEASRLQTPQNAKAVLAQAVQHIPHSVKIWIAAANLETDPNSKRRVFRRALEIIPTSVRLWKEAIELEEPEDARIMLSRAVECVPQSTDLWLALARLENYENAKRVLNKARSKIPTEPLIWITAAELEEAASKASQTDSSSSSSSTDIDRNAAMVDRIEKIISKAIKNLSAHQFTIEREQWLQYAEKAEDAGYVGTCQAIIRCTIGIGLEDTDRKHTWLEDAQRALSNKHIETARAIYAHALTIFKSSKRLWLKAAQLEKSHGTRESLEQLLKRAVSYCPNAEDLWLMAAKERWLGGDVGGARSILGEAFAANPDSELIWLAAVKLEHENNELERARLLLERAREKSGTRRVWMKSAKLEREVALRQLANTTTDTATAASFRKRERELLDEALQRYPDFDKLWLMRAQWEVACGSKEQAREMYNRALRNCPNSIPLWLEAARLEENFVPGGTAANVVRVRAILEKARLRNPKTPELWLAAVRTEMRVGEKNHKAGQVLLAKALQECPDSGLLWAEAIEMEPRASKNAKSVQALKLCDKDPRVIVAVARLFWADRKISKARSWFNRAVSLNPDFGDTWVHFFKFEMQHGSVDEQAALTKRCVDAQPRHGELWCSVSKQPLNERIGTEDILKKAVQLIQSASF